EAGGATGTTGGALAFDFAAGFELAAGSVFAGVGCAGEVTAAGVAVWACAGPDGAGVAGGSEDCVLSLQEASTPQAKSTNGTKMRRPRSWRLKRILQDVLTERSPK